MLIRVGDEVLVIRGVDKGTRGKVLKLDREKGRVVVEGVNKAYKHVKRSSKNPQGGRLSKEMGVSVSNVMLICPTKTLTTISTQISVPQDPLPAPLPSIHLMMWKQWVR